MLFNKLTLFSSLSLLLQSVFSSVLIFIFFLCNFLILKNIFLNINKNPVCNINHNLYEWHTGTLIHCCSPCTVWESTLMPCHYIIGTNMRGCPIMSPHLTLSCNIFILSYSISILFYPFIPEAISYNVCFQWSSLCNFVFGCIKAHFDLLDPGN